MDDLSVYKNRKKANLPEKNRKKAAKLIDDILHSMSFFRELVANEDLTMEEIDTHMGLFESYFNELIPIVKYDSILKEGYEQRYKEIRVLNKENKRLTNLLGKEISAEGLKGALRRCDDIFRAWYGSLGFSYASLKNYGLYGIMYEFSEELDHNQSDGYTGMKELSEKMCKDKEVITLQKNTGWNLDGDRYHMELLDTDHNRNLIRELFMKTFPESDIREFRSKRNDYGTFSMRFSVLVPYEDIFKLEKKYSDGN